MKKIIINTLILLTVAVVLLSAHVRAANAGVSDPSGKKHPVF